MVRYLGPRKKYERRFGLIEDKRLISRFRKRRSDYSLRLEEKQKTKFIYGIQERQFRKYVKQAQKAANPNLELMRLLETRLDNTVYRLGFAPTIPAARQLVSHGHVRIDGKRINIPSYHIKSGQTLALSQSIFENPILKEAWSQNDATLLPAWLNKKDNIARILHLPDLSDMRQDINTAYIFEYYSK